MTAQDDPYVRVYYRVLTDEKFKPLSSAAWGHWVRLLVIADGMYPSSAPLPRWVDRKPLHELVTAGIVDLEGADYFRIHGMKTERGARVESATFAADVKHHGMAEALRRRSERSAAASDRSPSGVRHDAPQPLGRAESASPLLSSPSLSSPLRANAPADDGSEYPVLAWLSQQGVTIPPTGNGYHRRVVVLVERYGPEKVRNAMAGAMAAGAKGDRAIVFGAENLLDPPPSGKAPAKGKGFNPTDDEAWEAFGGRPDVA